MIRSIKKRSIKKRLVTSYMIVILITVIGLMVILMNGIREYYYRNIEEILTNQIRSSSKFYSRLSSGNLEDVLIDDADVFWSHNTAAQVQILTLEGDLLMDSIGIDPSTHVITPDIEQAINGERGVWTGNVTYDDSSVMAISTILKSQNEPVGIIRFISSMEETNLSISQINRFLAAMGASVVILSGLVSLIISNSIVKPIENITDVAEQFAEGQFQTRSQVRQNDEIGKLSDTLNYMAEEILVREQIKNEFISSVSHELRTPLTSIKGWAATLQAGELDESLLEDGLYIIEKETDRLSHMVEELLDFSKILAGRMSLVMEKFDVKNTLEMIGKQLRPRSNKLSIEFEVEIGEDIGFIVGDENRIKQVVLNVLDNAFKFTNENGWVKLKAYTNSKALTIEVLDNGIGIPASDLPFVKEKFFKGTSSNSQNGMGLSIADEIISMHGGTFNIQSEESIGTKVEIKIPLEEEI